jgi:protein-L-isoaspartate O-methyltransferase
LSAPGSLRPMTEAAQRHDGLVTLLRGSAAASERILDAFERVPRHLFLPDVPLDAAYADDAIVTHDEGGVPTSSSSQPSLMARMLEQLDLGPGDRVLEIGSGTGYNAALMAELGAAVTTVELQPEVAAAACDHLRAAGVPLAAGHAAAGGLAADAESGDATAARDAPAGELAGDPGSAEATAGAAAARDATAAGDAAAGAPAGAAAAAGAPVAVEPGTVLVVTGDGATPPGGPYDRVIVTAGCWALPAAVVDSLADNGVIVAPLRVNGIELVLGLRRQGDVLRGGGAIPCGFMPMRGGDQRPWRWQLGAGGVATADADLGVEGRGALDRLLASPGSTIEDPLGLRDGEHALSALLWLALQGDPLLALVLPGQGNRPPWTVGLDVLPASLLVIELTPAFDAVAGATLHGGDAALRTCVAGMTAWRAAGSPGPAALQLTVERHGERGGWSLPYRTADGEATMIRGAHRWTMRYADG